MTNQLKYTLIFVILAVFTGCRNDDEGKLTFEMLESEKTIRLSNEELSPVCNVSLKLPCATKESGEVGKNINEAVVYRLFNQAARGTSSITLSMPLPSKPRSALWPIWPPSTTARAMPTASISLSRLISKSRQEKKSG